MTTGLDGATGRPGRSDYQIFISGAGVVGLAAALAAAQAGWPVTLVGPRETRRNGRTVALLDPSVRMLRALGVWERVAPLTAPLAVMRIVDDTGSLLSGPPLSFSAGEIGLPAFGYNVENAVLVEALEEAARGTAAIERIDGFFVGFRADRDGVQVETTGGALRRASLLLAADGRSSPVRTAAGIAARQTAYPQVALTAILRHAAPHRNVSTEFHTRQGPFTLVPMPPAPDAPDRSSLVWVMTPEEAERRFPLSGEDLAREIERQSRGLLGRLRLEGAVGRFPIGMLVAERLTAERLVLVGEAAHALPPIGAQGLNLSLRDAATLADHLAAARARGADPGARPLLEAYERSRRGDIALRAGAVDALNRSLLSSFIPVDLVRAGGLAALAALAPMRRAAMRLGLLPGGAIPSLMR